ncbi:MAG: tyrosine-type recombinase/integrase [Desulfomonilaceae bacterium]
MGLLIECPKCKTRNSPKTDKCSCGMALRKLGSKSYWIEFYDETGKRRRERIGPSKMAAEQRLRDVLKARTEERHIQKDLAARVTLGELCQWYLDLPEVMAKASFDRDDDSVQNLKRIVGEATKLRELTAGKIEGYQRKRLEEKSPVHPSEKVRPATVNREVACLKTMISRAIKHGKLDANPILRVKKLPENNVRERVLASEHFERLLEACLQHLKPIVLVAYYTGMRKSEILFLTWEDVDLQNRFIRLKGDRTKTGVARSVPLHPRVWEALSHLPRGIRSSRVFLWRGKPVNDVKKAFKAACTKAGLNDFTFHDLRHCAINNLRLAGNDYFKIMAISGHKTMNVFKRYNLVTEEELSSVTWQDQVEGSAR